jgi:hypothetical protein
MLVEAQSIIHVPSSAMEAGPIVSECGNHCSASCLHHFHARNVAIPEQFSAAFTIASSPQSALQELWLHSRSFAAYTNVSWLHSRSFAAFTDVSLRGANCVDPIKLPSWKISERLDDFADSHSVRIYKCEQLVRL